MSPGQTIEFLSVFGKQAKHNDADDEFKRRANLESCYLPFLVDKQEEFHEDIVSPEELDFL